MDKRIIDELIKFGLITNININAEKYNSIDDLINKGVITIPGAKSKIDNLLANINITKNVEPEPVVEPEKKSKTTKTTTKTTKKTE